MERGCPNLTYASRCAECATRHEARRLAEGATGRRGTTGSWRRRVKEVWRRDKGTCQNCGLRYQDALDEDKPFDVHHIDGDPRNDALVNLELLCHRCHEHLR